MTHTYQFDGYEIRTHQPSMEVTSRYDAEREYVHGPIEVYINGAKLDKRLEFLFGVFCISDQRKKSIAWKIIKREMRGHLLC
jgi:hypothetical protein